MAIPETLATNSALGGTLYGFPEHFLVVVVWLVFRSGLFNHALHARVVRLDTPEKFLALLSHNRKDSFVKVRLAKIVFKTNNILPVAV